MKTLILIAVLLVGCGSDAPAKSDPNSDSNTNGDADMGVGSDAVVLTEDDCVGLEVFYEDDCIVPERRVDTRLTAVANLPESFASPRVCASVLGVEESEARSFVSLDRVLEQTDDCVVTERLPDEERSAWPYEPDPDGLESATIRRDGEEWVLETVHEIFDECLTTNDPAPFEFGGTYEVDVPTGSADASAFPATIAIPEDPQPDCPIVVAGEPLEMTWTASGATNVGVHARIADIEIDCDVEDTGSYTIPAELTSLLPESGAQVVGVRPITVQRSYNPETETLTTFVGDAWNACEFVR